MKVLFLRPQPPMETIGLQHVMIVEPLELEILATLIEDSHQVSIADCIIDNRSINEILNSEIPDILCVTGYITHTDLMKLVCKEAKIFNSKIVTIVGGVHIESLPETIDSEYIDYRVVRNATRTFPQLIEYLAKIKTDFPSGVLRKYEKLMPETLPKFDFFVPIPNRKYLEKYRNSYFYVFHDKVALLKTSFGCPYQCNFCYCRTIAGNQYVERELSVVIQELLSINQKEIYIIDDNFLVSKKRLTEFMDLLEKHNIRKKFLIYGRADFIVENEILLNRFKHLGLRTIIVGFESFDTGELSKLNKETTSEINTQTMAVLNRIGVDCYASIIAMPEWSKSDFEKITKQMIKLKVRFLNIQPLTPLEKTDFRFDDTKLIVQRTEFAKWDLAHIVVQPEKMSVSDYYKQILRTYERVVFRPANLIHHLKYPLKMQIKLMRGVQKVRKQYIQKMGNL